MDQKFTNDHQRRILDFWQSEKVYAYMPSGKPLWNIDTPPPTVSGSLHLGHIYSYTHTDVVARYKRMNGFNVLYPFGFDDNGLPTERFVEKKTGATAHKVGRSEFIKICLQTTHEIEEQFKELWQSVGLSADWNFCYSTISDSTRRISQESFLRLLKDGYLYRKHEPALYCTACRTSVAQAELDDSEQPSSFNTIVFKGPSGEELQIATTRPEMLGACVAVFYHPDDARYKHLAGKTATVPLYNIEVPLIADDLVIPDKGTGLVMCCTFGDKTDITWFTKHNLPYKELIGRDGKLTAIAGELAGKSVKDARGAVIEQLRVNNLLIEQKPITHAVNVHERCKHEIEYLILSQWFLNILPYKEQFVQLADQIEWRPAHMKARYVNWVENLSWDWCISRQRYFGIPFPAWHCTQCAEIIPAQIEQLPIDPQETPYSGTCPKCGSSDIVPDTDVMDTWNTSSLTPYLAKDFFTNQVFDESMIPGFVPMAVRPQAHDIIRTWAFYTIVKSWMHNRTIPWKEIVISGHVLASNNEKLSKSKDNAKTSPQELLKQHSPDAIRFWAASSSLGSDFAFSESQIAIGSKLVNKLWNAYKFIVLQLQAEPEFAPDLTIQHIEQHVNRWILGRVGQTLETYHKAFARQETGEALQAVERLFWHDFCDNYLELIKDQFFNKDRYTEQQRFETLKVLYTVGLSILQMYAPITPFVTEEIYQHLYRAVVGAKSLHITDFVTVSADAFEDSIPLIDQCIEIIGAVRKLKSNAQLSLKTDLEELMLCGNNSAAVHAVKENLLLMQGITRAARISFNAERTEQDTITPEAPHRMTINLV